MAAPCDDPELQAILDRAGPGARVIRPGDELPPQPAPQEDPNEVREQREGLAEMRQAMDAAARLAKAEETKAQANEHFKNRKWKVSMVGYVAGIWFLKRGNPPCPRLVASPAGLDEVEASLGAGGALEAGGRSEEDDPPGFVTLRDAMHLNLAQAALHMEEWRIAKAACSYVLGHDAGNAKALFRLAKALQGSGELAAASTVVARLLKRDAQNAEARRLREALKRQQQTEKAAFRGLFDRAHAEGDGLYTREEERRDEREGVKKALEGGGDGNGNGVKTVRGADLMSMPEAERQAFIDEVNAAL